MSKTLYTGCLGNGKLTEVEVLQDENGTVRIMIAAGGNYAQVFSGTIEAARIDFLKMKRFVETRG